MKHSSFHIILFTLVSLLSDRVASIHLLSVPSFCTTNCKKRSKGTMCERRVVFRTSGYAGDRSQSAKIMDRQADSQVHTPWSVSPDCASLQAKRLLRSALAEYRGRPSCKPRINLRMALRTSRFPLQKRPAGASCRRLA